MSRRKGTPCACSSDPCGCGGSKSDCIKTVNNEYPDPNRNLEIKAGPGIQIIPADHGIEIINISDPDAFIAGDNIEIIDNADGTREIRLKDDIDRTGDTDLTGNVAITGDLSVNGNIIQNGAYYDTHAEHIYSRDDYIIMRDGAVAGLAAGDYSGFQVKLYDGVNDGRLVIDNSGVARVGDVGDEQPLLTRDEAADLTNDHLLKWDAANQKAIDAGKSVSDLQEKLTPVATTFTVNGMSFTKTVYGKEIIYSCIDQIPAATGTFALDTAISNPVYRNFTLVLTSNVASPVVGYAYLESGTNIPKIYIATNSTYSHVELRILTN